MATLKSIATGNFTAAATWGVCDATFANDTIAANTALTTAYVNSTGTVPGAITVRSIGCRIASVSASPTGTMSISLYNTTDATELGVVTINVSDISAADTTARGGSGWYFLDFGADLVLTAAKTYVLRAKTSSASMVNLFSLATTNWARQLVTTTTAAPAVDDNLIIGGHYTAAATLTSYTVTNNNTATTDFGVIKVGKGGTLAYGTTAATSYYLKTSGLMEVHAGGTLTMGTSGTPMPSSSTAVLEFDSVSAGGFGIGLRAGSVCYMYGANKLSYTTLSADEAAAQTVIGPLASTSGWEVSDELCFTSTSRSNSDAEKKTILTVDSATQVTLTAGLTNAHAGTAPNICTVGNLTRNVKIRGISGSFTGYMECSTTSAVYMKDVEVTNFGTQTSSRFGIVVETTTGSFRLDNCAVHDTSSPTGARGVSISSTSGSNITVNHSVFYNLNAEGVSCVATSGVHTIDSNILCKCGIGSSNAAMTISDAGSIVINNIINASSSSSYAVVLQEAAGVINSFTSNTISASAGIYGILVAVAAAAASAMSGNIVYRNSQNGISIVRTSSDIATADLVFTSWVIFGNFTSGVVFGSVAQTGNVIFKSCTIYGGTTLTQATGLTFASATSDSLLLEDCTFGSPTAHSSMDVSLASTGNIQFHMYNTLFATSTEVGSQNTMVDGWLYQGASSTKHDQVAGAYRAYQRNGTLLNDTTIYRTASPSLRMTPTTALRTVRGAFKSVAVASGQTCTVSGYVRESIAGDGTDYNGARITFVVRKNLEAGITADTVIATATAASEGAFELLTGTTLAVSADAVLEFYFTATGTTGWVNIDDVTSTSRNDPSGMKFWVRGNPGLSGEPGSGGSFTFS